MTRLGKQPVRHVFFLNPYRDARFTSCPQCGQKTRLRKFPLVIHIEPHNMLSLNKTCRYCPACDLLIAHQNELEGELAVAFSRLNPDVIGNDYLVIGTMDRADWRQGRTTPRTVQDTFDSLHDFKRVVRFEPQNYGWGP